VPIIKTEFLSLCFGFVAVKSLTQLVWLCSEMLFESLRYLFMGDFPRRLNFAFLAAKVFDIEDFGTEDLFWVTGQ
jgi:hypothetical protein